MQRSVETGVVQRIPVGYVPTAAFGTPYGGLNDPTSNRNGDQAFSDAQRKAIYRENFANHAGRFAPVPGTPGPVSDHSGNQLLERVEASQLTPEIDHIVPRDDEGANDVVNGRVLSKSENNAGGIPRPAGTQKRLAIYETIDVTNGPYGGDWVADDGDKLNLNQVGDLLRYANNGNKPASWAAASNVAVAQAIQNRGSGNTRNGVTVL
ncbi:MAG TPA: HNH endonuclease signature motif containing protein [Symbiobacteriaceae bacterium]|nr:HNH endonuclease signature motif containing protein [Symbiobacteriaceae bacterium]